MSDARFFLSDHRAQATRLNMIRMELRRQRRPDAELGCRARFQCCGYYGLTVRDGVIEPSKILPKQDQAGFFARFEWLFGFRRTARPQFA
jgi:hypothetical protein